MKLISLSVANLASITKASVDFESGLLEGVGLYAITGDTGAGKSTLLDAICLALYGKTARLKADAKNTVAFNGDEVKLNDPRNLLRRGCGVGHAEVEFVGNDTKRYIARWAIARARKKSTGRLQKATHEVLCGESKKLISDKTAAAKFIESAVGLNFEQFTRAVMLAQHEFAAFLKASADERAQLLERLTNTHKFSRIGQVIFERHKEKKQELDTLKASLGNINLLSEQELAELHQALLDRQIQTNALSEQIRSLEAQQRHLRDKHQLSHQLSGAKEGLLALEAELEQKQSLSSDIELMKYVERVSENRTHYAQQQVRFEEQQQRFDALTKVDFEETRTQLIEHMKQCEVKLKDAETVKEKAHPLITQVTELDEQCAVIQTQVNTHQSALKHLEETLGELQSKCEKNTLASLECKQKLIEVCKEVESNSKYIALQPDWPVIESQLLQILELTLAIRDADTDYLAEKAQLEHVESELTEKSAQLARANSEQTQAQETTHIISQQLKTYDVCALENRKSKLLEVAQQKKTLKEIEVRQQENFAALHVERGRLALHQSSLSQVEKSFEEAKLRESVIRDNFSQIQLRTSERVSALRAQLKPGNECMVCGSKDHPYEAQGIDVHWQNLLSDFEIQIKTAKQTRHELEVDHLELLRLIEKSKAHIQLLNSEATQLQTTYDSHTDALGHLLASLSINVSECDEETKKVEAALVCYFQLMESQQSANEALQSCQLSMQALQSDIELTTSKRNQISESVAVLFKSTEQFSQQIERTRSEVQKVWTERGWWTEFDNNGAEAVSELQEKMRNIANLMALESRLQSERNSLNLDAEAYEKEMNAVLENRLIHQNSLVDFEKKLRLLIEQRNSLLPAEQSAQQWQSDLDRVVFESSQELTKANTALSQCDADTRAHKTKMEEVKTQLVSSQTQLNELSSRFERWFEEVKAQFGEEGSIRAKQLLSNPLIDWKKDEHLLQGMLSSLIKHQAQVESLELQLEKISQVSSDVEDEIQLKTSITRLSEEFESAQQSLVSSKAQLKQHEDNVKHLADRQGELQQLQSHFEHWHCLNTLLGDATGKTMRNWAQSQTLKILLQYANQHLVNLTKRYRLKVINGSLDIAVVDKDMADEERTVNTLSGGESFLISLSLALGLASLSSNSVRIQSLFIDEGFGTLDADSLSMALDALDSLQSQGRKVGVISHVAEMAERVSARIHVKKQPGGFSTVEVKQQ